MATIPIEFIFGAEFPTRRLIARVSRVEQIGEGPRARYSYEFDAIDASVGGENLDQAIAEPGIVAPFALLRIVTTPRRIARIVGLEPTPGHWYLLEIAPRKQAPGPVVYHAQLGVDGYNVQSKGALGSGDFLFSERGPEPAFRPLGAAVNAGIEAARALAHICHFPAQAVATQLEVSNLLNAIQKPTFVIVQDVGQASFCSFTNSAREPILYFDVGWPLVFNGRTAPINFDLPRSSPPVILSHWDFDHLFCFHKFRMRKNKWVTPVQNLGPGARKIAETLSNEGNLLGWPGGSCQLLWGELSQGTGDPSESNDSGLVLQVELASGRKVLLVGDAGYNSLPFSTPPTPDFLVVTHHGAKFTGNVPIPIAHKSRCVVSVGNGNVYGHPNADAIKIHKRTGWTVDFTSGNWQQSRGSRELGP